MRCTVHPGFRKSNASQISVPQSMFTSLDVSEVEAEPRPYPDVVSGALTSEVYDWHHEFEDEPIRIDSELKCGPLGMPEGGSLP